MRCFVLPGLGLCSLFSSLVCTRAADVQLTKKDDRVLVTIGGSPFTEYVFSGAKRPYMYPILMADGTSLTRDFPMKETPGEDQDHPWHRALWFAHSFVNGVDFWNEGEGDVGHSPKSKGSIVQESLDTKGGPVGVIHTRNRWMTPEGELVCTDERTVRIRSEGQLRMIDYEVKLQALADKDLLIGDNKDGTMAIRVAEWMTLPHKYQKRDLLGEGHIVTSTGFRDSQAWGKRADWCDYHAPREGKTYGIAIFDHPQNLRHPTWWMAREYGLFGANPFGQHDYENLKDQPHVGDCTIPAGGALTLRYRFVFHYGDENEAHLADLYKAYADESSK